jgi:hypothetical protein
MTPQERLALLLRGGKVLYGPSGWQTQLAAGLGINLRTVQRWVAGGVGYPEPAVIERLAELLTERAAEIEAMGAEIKMALEAPPVEEVEA